MFISLNILKKDDMFFSLILSRWGKVNNLLCFERERAGTEIGFDDHLLPTLD